MVVVVVKYVEVEIVNACEIQNAKIDRFSFSISECVGALARSADTIQFRAADSAILLKLLLVYKCTD